jgi:hypothetical protein
MLETDYNSSQSGWNDELTVETMRICRQEWGECNFIFASNRDNTRFFDDKGVVSARNFTIRQVALINDYANLFIGVSSGVSVATSAWGLKPTPKIQYCNSLICSTASLSNGDFELVAPSKEINKIADIALKNSKMKDIYIHTLLKTLHAIT